jgi:hypothetical protein
MTFLNNFPCRSFHLLAFEFHEKDSFTVWVSWIRKHLYNAICYLMIQFFYISVLNEVHYIVIIKVPDRSIGNRFWSLKNQVPFNICITQSGRTSSYFIDLFYSNSFTADFIKLCKLSCFVLLERNVRNTTVQYWKYNCTMVTLRKYSGKARHNDYDSPLYVTLLSSYCHVVFRTVTIAGSQSYCHNSTVVFLQSHNLRPVNHVHSKRKHWRLATVR